MLNRVITARHRIVYDPACRFCRWSLGWVLRWDRRGALEPIPLGGAEARRLLGGLTEPERMASWHLVAPDGAVSSGGDAAAPLLRLLPAGAPLAGLAARLPGAVDAAYASVVGNRGRLGRRLPERSLARADALIAERQPGQPGGIVS